LRATETQILCYSGYKLVEPPQPTSNPNLTLNEKQLLLPKLFIDEVAGLAFLLLI
jgi:hypothetical protein